MNETLLIIFSGLPGTGKTTISKEIAKQLKAVYLRVDTIEQTLRNFTANLIGPEGYLISYAIAKDNLGLGLSVIADSVNPIEITRKTWREVANSVGVKYLEIEIVCSDLIEHQKRIETRVSDIKGHKLPTWGEVKMRDYEKWDSVSITIDTAVSTPNEAIKTIMMYLDGN